MENNLKNTQNEPIGLVEEVDVESDLDLTSSIISMESGASAASGSGAQLRKRTRPRAKLLGSNLALSDEDVPAPKVATAQGRKRRPVTTGKCVGWVKAQKDLTALKMAEEIAEKEGQSAKLADKGSTGQAICLLESSEVLVDELSANDLNQRLTNAVAAIQKVGKVSKGLSGVYKKTLREATASIVETAEALLRRTSSRETARLQAQNTRLEVQVAEHQKEIDELKAEMAKYHRELRKEVRQPQSQESELAKLRQEMASLSARFGVFEGKQLRPPLAADRITASKTTYAAKTSAPRTEAQPDCLTEVIQPVPVPLMSLEAKKGKGKGKKTAVSVAPSTPGTSTQVPTQKSSAASYLGEGQWETVGAKKKAKKAIQQKAKTAKKESDRLRAPRSAAVVLTMQPEAQKRGLTYAEVILKAKSQFQLSDVGITGIRFKYAATGAIKLEIPGVNTGPQADAFAEKLKASLDAEDVRVSRPVKCADLRIMDLDDSVTTEVVAAAVAKAGECPLDQVKVGTIRPGFSGLRTVLVSCPVAAARKLKDGPRLVVGWDFARVKLLANKPLRCYRCMREGHVGVRCTSEVDCCGLCFRCGQPGHKASSCNAAPHCVVCAALNRSADHQTGSKACTRDKKADSNGKIGPSKSACPPPGGNKAQERAEGEAIVMDTQ